MEGIKSEKALGLVEALIALAVVGTGMVLITYISLKTIKEARKNELQDVAVQSAVEAMDFMKYPAAISTYTEPTATPIPHLISPYVNFKLDFGSTPPRIVKCVDSSDLSNDPSNCDTASPYYVASLGPEYLVCQQIKVTEVTDLKYNIEVVVVWQSVGGDFEMRVIQGYRLGSIGH